MNYKLITLLLLLRYIVAIIDELANDENVTLIMTYRFMPRNISNGTTFDDEGHGGFEEWDNAVIDYINYDHISNVKSDGNHENIPANLLPILNGDVVVGDTMAKLLAYTHQAEEKRKNSLVDCQDLYQTGGYYLYTICRLHKCFGHYNLGQMSAWLQKTAYSTFKRGTQFISASVDLAAARKLLAGDTNKPLVKHCEKFSYPYNQFGIQWTVSVLPWSYGADCDATGLVEDIKSRLNECRHHANAASMTSWCCRIDHKGNWHADIRVIRNDAPSGLWQIPCQYQ